MHPCAYLSRKLSPAERNYDVGNKELLAVKVALEECRHWLEGAEQPFLVWTDHKSLEYIKRAKRLNLRQARWSLGPLGSHVHAHMPSRCQVYHVHDQAVVLVAGHGKGSHRICGGLPGMCQ